MSKILSFLILSVALLAAAPAQAHSKLASSIPADGSTVSEPKTVTMTFTRDLRLVTVRLTSENFDEALTVDRAAATGTSFSLALPAIVPGTYKVKWRAAATEDGHIMTGTFSFTVGAHVTGTP